MANVILRDEIEQLPRSRKGMFQIETCGPARVCADLGAHFLLLAFGVGLRTKQPKKMGLNRVKSEPPKKQKARKHSVLQAL